MAEHLLDARRLRPALGARPMRGAVQRLVEAPIADAILQGRVAPGEVVRVRADAGELRFGR